MTDEEKLKTVAKEFLLIAARLQESITALGIVLKERGILDHPGYLAALAMAQEANRPLRERIEKLETLDPMLELLRGFQGPIQ